MLVWENTWAAPFGSAVRRSGGELLGNGRIPTQALIAAVEADRQAGEKGAGRWACSEIEETDPVYSAGVMSGGMTAPMTGATAARTAAMTAVTAGMTAATGVPDPGCCGDSSTKRSALDGTVQVSASIGPTRDPVIPEAEVGAGERARGSRSSDCGERVG